MTLTNALASSSNKLAYGVCQRTGEVFVASKASGAVVVKGFYGVHIWNQSFPPSGTWWQPARVTR